MALGGPPRSHENELPPRLFSHQYLEEEFSELRLNGVLRSSLAINITGKSSMGLRRTPINAIMRWWVSANRQDKAGGDLTQIDEA
jgi:hypothetical protein